MGTDEACMAWIKDEIGRAAGLPSVLGGIPLDEVGATGWGVAQCAEVAAPYCGLKLKGARVAIQGYGAVGRHAARFLVARGCVLVAASDSKGTLADPDGIDVPALSALKDSDRNVGDFPRGRRLDRDAVLGIDCDIFIPAARPDVLREENAGALRAKLVLQGANIPFTAGAEQALYGRGVLVVPDFIANAGGVICAAMEYAGAGQAAAFDAISEKIRANTEAVVRSARDRRCPPREAATDLATQRVREAMGYRHHSIL
jgi:glutamate dehydrogenase (NAD(P)+)